MRRGWRLRAVGREALANVASGGARPALLVVAFGGLFGAVVAAELAFSADVRDQAERFDAAGGRVAVVDGPDGLDAARCEAVRWQPTVVAAGGWRNAGQIAMASSPRVLFGRWEVTGEIARVWDPAAPRIAGGGYIVGQAAGAELGLADGAWLVPEGEPAGRVRVFDPAARNEFATRTILDPVAPEGRLAQCWVEFRPGALEGGLGWLPAHFADDEAEARRAVSRGEFGIDPAETLANRIQRWAWLPVGIVGAAALALMALFRRSETAVYRAFGLSQPGLLIMHQVEAIVLVSGSLAVGALWAIAGHAVLFGIPGADQLWLALRTAVMGALLIVILGPLGAWLAGSGSPATLLKER